MEILLQFICHFSLFKHREIKGNIKQATIKKDKAENYFATFIVEENTENRNYSISEN